MKYALPVVFFLSLFSACTKPAAEEEIAPVSIIPKPQSVQLGNQYVYFENAVSIIAPTDEAKRVAALMEAYFLSQGISVSESGSPSITLSELENSSKDSEGYSLIIDNKGITIKASGGAGLFYGFQTFLQLITDDGKKVPYVSITDAPRFAYRGLHLDVTRHMFPPAFIKKYIDLMAHHKFNRFHWHLTEDQGWRIEIKKYPELQKVAAFRDETIIGHAGTATRNGEHQYDGQRYGGYYTQEEIKDIVKYARDRYVTIIPEIEMPGHAQAALAAYPSLGCTGGPYEVAKTWGVFDEVYCAGKEETFEFLENVLDEVIELFPGEYIHIGGDECPKVRWEACPFCKKRMADENLEDAHQLQSYFIQRIESYLNQKGKQIIGWDEILEGGLAPNATVMSWRGEEGGIAAAKQQHNVVMTPGNWCYFDHYQDSSKSEPLAIGGLTTVKEVYSYEPIPPQLSKEEEKYILGAQANVWSEYITTPEHAEYMVYPRACAMAEVVWTGRENRNYEDFLSRMQPHFKRLDRWGVNYAKHIQDSTLAKH